MPRRLILYGRSYCHLCEDMAAALRDLEETLDFSFSVVDVDAEPELEKRFGELVPVLTDAEGREICHYFLDLAALKVRLAVK